MFKRLILPAVVAGVAAFAGTAVPASATVLPAKLPLVRTDVASSPNHTEVRHRPGHDRRAVRRYDRRLHGDRCLRRYGGCRHYYGGYYYRTPWWLFSAPFIGGQVIISGGRRHARHVAWCEDRYRSYNRRTNTWLSYSGEVRQCDSPYDNR